MDAPKPLLEAKECCPTSTRKRIQFKHALLVDVREREEFDKISLDVPYLLNIPMSEFERRFAELPRDREVILVSADGQDSMKATYYLMREGYTDVLSMTGGVSKWVFRGYPVKGDPGAIAGTAPPVGCCQSG